MKYDFVMPLGKLWRGVFMRAVAFGRSWAAFGADSGALRRIEAAQACLECELKALLNLAI